MPDTRGHPTKIQGSIEVELTDRPDEEICFYLPYNDPEYGQSRLHERAFQNTPKKISPISWQGGNTQIELQQGLNFTAERINAYLWRVKNNGNLRSLKINFTSTPPSPPDYGSFGQWFFDGYFPLLLQTCPSPSKMSLYFKPRRLRIDHFAIAPFADHNLVFPANRAIKNAHSAWQNPMDLAFAAQKGFQTLSRLTEKNILIEMHYISPMMPKLMPTIEATVNQLVDIYGFYPYEKIIILETQYMYRANLEGLVILNKPRQSLFHKVQSEWLNWWHWTMVNLLVQQWWGAALQIENPDEQWLLRGASDFYSLQVLAANKKRFNLFNNFDTGFNFLTLTYLEMQNINAALLYRNNSLAVLTDENLRTQKPLMDQDVQLSIRHAVAMRFLNAYLGQARFNGLMRDFAKAKLYEEVTAKDFYTSLEDKSAQDLLKQWWTRSDWPDVSLKSFTPTPLPDGRWMAEIVYEQKTDLDVPVTVQVEDEKHSAYQNTSEPTNQRGVYKSKIFTASKPVDITLDHEQAIYDLDRYNNTTKSPDVKFFPGSARGISEDGYTVLWGFYPFRRAGQPWSLALQTGIFRYINNGLLLSVETEMAGEKRSAFALHQTVQTRTWALNLSLNAEQDRDGNRVLGLQVEKNPFLLSKPRLGVFIAPRHRQLVGEKDTSHQTGAVGFSFSLNQNRVCFHDLSAEYETAPPQTSRYFQYDKRLALFAMHCLVKNFFDLGLRIFRGEFTGSENVPRTLLFNPQDEKFANLRLDVSGVRYVHKILGTNSNLYVPVFLPLPGGSFVDASRLKAHVFYDYGRALDATGGEFRASGAGLYLPFSGDISGAGSLSLTSVSLLFVYYSHNEGDVSRATRVLFNIVSDL